MLPKCHHRTAACLATARQPNLLQQIQLSNDGWPWYAGHIRDAARIHRLAGMQVSHGRTGRDKKGFKAARVDVPEFPIGRQKKKTKATTLRNSRFEFHHGTPPFGKRILILPKCHHRTIAGGLFLRGSECLDARPLVPVWQSKDIGR